LEDRFGVAAKDFVLYDALILGIVAPAKSQPIHRDASLVTINIALSSTESFRGGGGTYFEGLDSDSGAPTPFLQIEKGHMLAHAGGMMHAGVGIETGERWVLVLFIIAKPRLQLARRFHARG
jgi:hypothetical protein